MNVNPAGFELVGSFAIPRFLEEKEFSGTFDNPDYIFLLIVVITITCFIVLMLSCLQFKSPHLVCFQILLILFIEMRPSLLPWHVCLYWLF